MNTGQTGRPRKYPRARVGDTFGDRTVTAILRPDSTCNETVEWRCICGRWGKSYVFNIRKNPVCKHGAAPCMSVEGAKK